jgi:diaminopimelate decarboxylase
MKLTMNALKCDHVQLMGFHCHVGSQVFDGDVFMKCADVMFRFMKEVQNQTGYQAAQLNLGGGYGIGYVKEDPTLDVRQILLSVGAHVKRLCQMLQMDLPQILMEPGRSIVADSGMTLYHVGTVKRIPDAKTYVSVDGGMTDNPRYALYRAKYTLVCANRMHEKASMRCSVVGKCCESGDTLQENVMLPESVQRNDVIAVLNTGAYNYSMASNYNRIVRPAVVMINGEDEKVVVQREKLEDLIKNEI